MILIIDGYNLMFFPDWQDQGRNLEEKRADLIRKVAQYQEQQKISKVILVFDGQPGVSPYERIISRQRMEIIYAIGEGKADEKIISLSEKFYGANIVTADRKIIQRTKKYNAKILSPAEFLHCLRSSKKEEKKYALSDDQGITIDEWLEIFELDAEIEIPDIMKQNPKRQIGTKK
ncbi:MAG: NYN domain-containing protein [Candidatus Brocadiae bacterium]|nr:NYN domain-containing protein [Candidatus Brocadiia bacterium]